ncbi:hypothetical protein ACH41H_25030 [Streptomyces sp. NPDC020800]|uniref:hypothetical protein n=1 Tax=Streptomyces sp. NPDC020800 TaxID=3365092 RepID=UPI0037B7DEE7
MNPAVLAAHYGRGTIFPVIPVDTRPIWSHPGTGHLPTPHQGGHDLLALRWCSAGPAHEQALGALRGAAQKVPGQPLRADELSAYAAALPDGVRLIALRQTALLGPWHSRPGAHTP